MGFNQDCQVNLEVPRNAVSKIEAFITEWHTNRFAFSTATLAPDNVMGDGLCAVLGEDGDVETFWRGEEPTTPALVGATWGKSSVEEEQFLLRLAKLGVTGTVDARGEDGNLWRWRLRDGEVQSYVGVVQYPGDPYGR